MKSLDLTNQMGNLGDACCRLFQFNYFCVHKHYLFVTILGRCGFVLFTDDVNICLLKGNEIILENIFDILPLSADVYVFQQHTHILISCHSMFIWSSSLELFWTRYASWTDSFSIIGDIHNRKYEREINMVSNWTSLIWLWGG